MSVTREDEQVRWHLHGLDTGEIFGFSRWAVQHLPRSLADLAGDLGTWLAFHLAKETTAALVANQRVVVPGLSERGRRELALRTYRTYAREASDFFRSLSMDQRQLSTLMSPASTHDLKAEGKGVLLVTGHIGNLELGAVLLQALFDYRLTVVVLPEVDPAVSAMRRKMRAELGIESLEVREAVYTALQIRSRLAENRVVVLVCDRALGRDRVDVDFFGRPTGFLRTPAVLGYLTGAPLVPSFILRQPDGRYIGCAMEPIHVRRTGDRDADVRTAMQAFASILEAKVVEYPHLWYQFYPYWGNSGQD
jgi:lauroyl/myristoyl acyltransferase